MTSWNIGSFNLRSVEVDEVRSDVTLLQETGSTPRQQRWLSASLADQGWSVTWGRRTPLGMDAQQRNRPQTAKVAICHREHVALRPFTPVSDQGKHLHHRGRLVMASFACATTKAMILCCYMPSGWSDQDRRSCLDDVACEVAALGDVPVYMAGDWNVEPMHNPLLLPSFVRVGGTPPQRCRRKHRMLSAIKEADLLVTWTIG